MSDARDTEIERLRARVLELETYIVGLEAENECFRMVDDKAAGWIALLRKQGARVTALEAEIAILRGTLSRYDEPDEPLIVVEYPPNAPR